MNKFRLGLIQIAVSAVKSDNLLKASKLIKQAALNGAKIVVLPECFNSSYGTKYFATFAEEIPGESTKVLANAAKENNVFLVGGSIPELSNGSYYNTSCVFNSSGTMIAKHRKVHLFDIDIPGKITVKESDVLLPGNQLTMFDTPYCKVGLGICFDMRFSAMSQLYADKGCKLLIYPGAFNMTTGPAHWELLQRTRAVDAQVFFATASPARDETADYVAWGHSMAVDPWGNILAEAGHDEEIVYADIDIETVDQIREQVPTFKNARRDLYSVTLK